MPLISNVFLKIAKELKPECAYFLGQTSHLGPISDPLIVLKFHNETYDPKGQENKIYTIRKIQIKTAHRRKTSDDIKMLKWHQFVICCIPAYSGTSVSLFRYINAVFNGVPEKESIIRVRME